MTRLLLSFLLGLGLAVPAAARDLLVINNGDRGTVNALTGGDGLNALIRDFEDRDIQASIAARKDAFGIRESFLSFANGLDDSTDDVVVVLIGRFRDTATGIYLLPTNARGNLSLGQVLMMGFPVDAALALAADYPGQALVVLGDTEHDADATAPRLDIPQGVTVAHGPSREAARFARRLSQRGPEDSLADLRGAGMAMTGFVPQALPIFADRGDDLPRVVEPDDAALLAAARAAWQTAQNTNTEAAYEAYLATYPNGENVAEARQRLAAIRSEPFFREKQIEEALNLSRNARRQIQRHLSLLGYNTRGIDGIFGRGTRAAVSDWQAANGLSTSGYMSAAQVNRLAAQAERRAAEIEEEARQRQAELERRDRGYWAETGAVGDEAGFRAYLDRFPDGVFSNVAQDRLDAIDAERRAQAENSERAIWQRAREADTIEAYQGYLDQLPNGIFAEEARGRIDWLVRNADFVEAKQQGQVDEAALQLNAAGRQIVESRLQAIGLDPGRVDGQFDDTTRRAIRRYQDARRLRVSGYLDQATMVRLMADAILR